MKKLSLILAVLFSTTLAHAYITVSPGYVSFGNVSVNSSSYSATIFVWNHGNENEYLNVYGFCPEFVVYDSCFTLPPRGMCTITAQMQPRTEGAKYCNVNVSARSGFGQVILNGTAIAR